jgi:hypothetical protein
MTDNATVVNLDGDTMTDLAPLTAEERDWLENTVVPAIIAGTNQRVIADLQAEARIQPPAERAGYRFGFWLRRAWTAPGLFARGMWEGVR